MKKEIEDLLLEGMALITKAIAKAERENLTDEQWFIDYEIKLSELATQDHKANEVARQSIWINDKM